MTRPSILSTLLSLAAVALVAQSAIVPMLPSLPPTTTWIVETNLQTSSCSSSPAVHFLYAPDVCIVGPLNSDPVGRSWTCNATHVIQTVYQYQNCTEVQQVNGASFRKIVVRPFVLCRSDRRRLFSAFPRDQCVGNQYSAKDRFSCDTIGGAALVQKYGTLDPGSPAPVVVTSLYRDSGECNSTSNMMIYLKFAVHECYGFSGYSYLRGCSDSAHASPTCDNFCQNCNASILFTQSAFPARRSSELATRILNVSSFRQHPDREDA
jgi:hypothetical protein